MVVGVDQAGKHERPRGVDLASRRHPPDDLVGRANRHDPVALDGDGARAEDGIGRIDGDDAGGGDEQVGVHRPSEWSSEKTGVRSGRASGTPLLGPGIHRAE